MNNRLGITVRLNLAEQNNMRSLMEMWGIKDPKRILKLAFDQFVVASAEIQKKIPKEDPNASTEATGTNDVAAAGDVGGDGSPAVAAGDGDDRSTGDRNGSDAAAEPVG